MVSTLKLILEFVSVACVAVGLITTFNLAISRFIHRSIAGAPLITVRLQFGTWLAVALEFQLGADIIATTISPSFRSLGELALLAGIRTFLNIFLGKELEAAERIEEKPQK